MDMELDFDGAVTPEVRRHVRRVTAALGLSGDCWCVQTEQPTSVYLPLDGRLPAFPNMDVALLWHEGEGWSVAIEPSDGGDLVVLGHLDGPPIPSPETVADWVTGLFRPARDGAKRLGHPPRQPTPHARAARHSPV